MHTIIICFCIIVKSGLRSKVCSLLINNHSCWKFSRKFRYCPFSHDVTSFMVLYMGLYKKKQKLNE
jgi:hypothetical protein